MHTLPLSASLRSLRSPPAPWRPSFLLQTENQGHRNSSPPLTRLSHLRGKGSWASSSKLQGDRLEMLPTLPLYSLPIPMLGDRMVGTMGQAEGSFSKDISPLNPHPLHSMSDLAEGSKSGKTSSRLFLCNFHT